MSVESIQSLYDEMEAFRVAVDGSIKASGINVYSVAFDIETPHSEARLVEQLVKSGARLTSSFRVGYLRMVVEAAPGTALGINPEDELSTGYDDRVLDDVRDAVGRSDIARLLELSPGGRWTGELSLSVRPEVTGFSWAPRLEDVLQALETTWFSTLNRLFTGNEEAHLCVADITACVKAKRLLIFGPMTGRPDAETQAVEESAASYRETYLQGRGLDLPAPDALVPIEAPDPRVRKVLRSVSNNLCWYWLASRVEVSQEGVVAFFDGARLARVPLQASEHGFEDALSLWAWATSTTEQDRRSAVEHAASLALYSEEDIATAGLPVLRTAKSVYQLSRQGVIAEAIATRRAARDAVMQAAGTVAEDARNAAGKALERVVLQTAAVGGLLLANSQNLLNDLITLRLLEVVSVILVVSAGLAAVQHLGAFSILSAFANDLDKYRDTLSQEDVSGLKQSQVLVAARKHAWINAGASFIIFLLAGGVMVPLLVHYSQGSWEILIRGS